MSLHEPLISIIVPVYNTAAYLERCIDSIVTQSCKNLEIILVDDGSEDHSAAVITSYALKDPRVIALSQNNSGQATARNKGIDASSGDYLIFADSDDWLEPDMVQVLLDSALDTNADIVCCSYHIIREKSNRITGQVIYKEELNTRQDILRLCLSEHIEPEYLTTTIWGKLYRSTLIRQNAIIFRQVSPFEDTPFFIECIYHSRKVHFCSSILYNYLVRNSSSMNSPVSEKKIENFYKADDIIFNFLKDKGLAGQYFQAWCHYHFTRILLYGGYAALYFRKNVPNPREAYHVCIKYLRTQNDFFAGIDKEDFSSFDSIRARNIKAAITLYALHRDIPDWLFRNTERYIDRSMRKLTRSMQAS